MMIADPHDLDDFPDAAAARPLWLITLADLALLLVGFFVLMQAHRSTDRHAIADALRVTFGGKPPSQAPAPLPLAAAMVTGFASGSSVLPAAAPQILPWVNDVSRDPRVMLTITGSVDGGTDDVDAETGSSTLLAADRARAVAAMIARARPGVRIAITASETDGQHRRAVLVSLGFAGDRQPIAGRQSPAAAPQP